MKKIGLSILAVLALGLQMSQAEKVSADISASPSSAAVSQSGEVAALRAELASLQEKLRKQIEDDMAILAKLRAENRALKKELRALRLEVEANKIETSKELSKITQQAQADVPEKADKPSAEEIAAARRQSEEAKAKAAAESAAGEKKKESKNGSIWDNMFPF